MFQANFENNQKKIFSLGHTKTGNQSIYNKQNKNLGDFQWISEVILKQDLQ